ncbi:hypothetical protein, partial [Helicobacter pylori]|uniref:hypothetical protein n=1 Tax=Helicobacter pylori TaxID=210 RepID=UPI001E62A2B3
LAFLFNFIIDYILVLYFSVAFLFLLFLTFLVGVLVFVFEWFLFALKNGTEPELIIMGRLKNSLN